MFINEYGEFLYLEFEYLEFEFFWIWKFDI